MPPRGKPPPRPGSSSLASKSASSDAPPLPPTTTTPSPAAASPAKGVPSKLGAKAAPTAGAAGNAKIKKVERTDASAPLQHGVWKDMFVYFDVDHDGKLNFDDAVSYIFAMGVYASLQDIRDLFGDNKLIDYVDIQKFMDRKWPQIIPKTEVLDAFRIFDKDGHGSIRTPDMRQYMVSLGEKLDSDEIAKVVQIVDPAETGAFQYEEILNKLEANGMYG